jgi:hypothetical protein
MDGTVIDRGAVSEMSNDTNKHIMRSEFVQMAVAIAVS